MDRKRKMDKAASSSLAAVDLNNPSLKFGLITFKYLISTMKDLPPSAIMSLQPACNVHLSNVLELGYPVGDLEHQIDCLMLRCRSYMDLDSMSPQEVAEAVLVPDIQSGIEQISSNKNRMMEENQALSTARQHFASLQEERANHEHLIKEFEENDADTRGANIQLQELRETFAAEGKKLRTLNDDIYPVVERLQETKANYDNVNEKDLSFCTTLKNELLDKVSRRISMLLDSIISEFP